MEGYNQTQQNSFNQDRPYKPNNNMPLAIIGTILGLCSPCCIGLILGIVSIVFSSQVETKYLAGDYAGAESSAKNAKILAFIAIGLFFLNILLVIIQILTIGMDGLMDRYEEILNQSR